MKITSGIACALLLSLVAHTGFAATPCPLPGQDSSSVVLRKRSFPDRVASSRAYRMSYVAVPVIVAGFLVKNEDSHFRSTRNSYLPSFRYHYDDYLQYLPAALMVSLKVGGVEGRSSWGRMLTADAFAAGLTLATTHLIKSSAKITRPDGSGRNSFPSGHTATAFMAATMLHKEYGLTRSPWYSVGAYTLATGIGLSRVANNKHWISDVMVGAGIGIFTTEIAYWLTDIIFKDKGIRRDWLPEPSFERNCKPSFFGLYLGFDIMPGQYRLHERSKISFSTGGNVGLEGAWFWNRHWGVGGRFTVSSVNVSVDGKAQDNLMDAVSSYGGIYFSCPITSRWFFGSKLLAGCRYTPEYTYKTGTFGGRGVPAVGTGLSTTFLANRGFGMKFFTDYNLTGSAIDSGAAPNHTLTIGFATNIMF